MRMQKISYAGYRFPPEIIQQAIWLYLRFTLSLRDVEDLMAERGVDVSCERVRRWVSTGYGNVALFPTRGNHVDLHGLPGGERSLAKPVCGVHGTGLH
jgi:hypothetical protein